MPRLRAFISGALALPLLLVAGCGGGGGNPPSSTTGIRVVTDWANALAGGPTGQSEKIQVVKPDGSIYSETVVNSNAASTTSAIVGPSGTYTVRIQLMSGADGSGTVNGTLETTAVSSSTSITVSVGAVATALRFVPSSADIPIGGKIRLGLVGVDVASNYAFLAPGSFTISGSGSAATISSDGVATGVSQGTTNVTATKGALTATALVNVKKASVTRSKWTVLVFLNASNDLYPYAKPNINQMEKVAYNPDVRFVVQWKESKLIGSDVDFDSTRRYLVKSDSTSAIKSEVVQDLGAHVDMGDVNTLRDFIAWGKENYPADRYVVVLWNHGNGWQRGLRAVPPPTRGISYDFEFDSSIDAWHLPQALEGQSIDILSFDACLMQMLEIASEVKNDVQYIAASEDNTPGPGYPYDRVFKIFADNPNGTTRALSKGFVDGHVNNPPYKDMYITQSVVDCAKIPAVETAIDALGGQLIDNRSSLTTVIPAIRSSMSKYPFNNDGRYYYDLVDLGQKLQAHASVPAGVKTAAGSMMNAVKDAVVWNGYSDLDSFSNGLSIDFSPSTSLSLALYGNLNLAKITRWDDWLKQAP